MISIPTKFRVANMEWTVVYDPDLPDSVEGETRYRTRTVHLRPGMDKDYTEHTFLHELTHVILSAMGNEKLNSNEGHVDSFAGLLHQFLKTKRGNVDANKDREFD